MKLFSPLEIRMFLSDREKRKRLVVILIFGMVVAIGGFLLVKQISKMRPTENGVTPTEDGGDGEPVAPPPPPTSPLEELGESVKEYEADLEEIGKFDLELYPPDLQLKVSF